MKKFKFSSNILPLLAAGITLVSLSGCNKKTKEIQQNQIGHIDEKPSKIPENEFVLYHVGNYEETGIEHEKKYIKKCEEKNISTGIIIDSDASSIYDIYEDVEFTKSEIQKYTINMPVYFNIENIMENDDLSMTEKAEYIKEYLSLIEKNNIYVGLYGTSTNLTKLDVYGLSISNNYDCFVVEDGKTKYNGYSTLRQDEEGNIYSTFQNEEYKNDISSFITKNKLNNPERLKQNETYIVDEDNTIERIAITNNLSINALLEFNNLSKEKIKNGTTIRIPNKIKDNKELVYPKLVRSDYALSRGIDISHYQTLDENITFKKLSNYIDFVILKIGEMDNNEFKIDDKFYDFYNECSLSNIPLGGYYVTNATTKEEALQEVNAVIEIIKDLKMKFPIFIDFEVESHYEKEFNDLIKNESLDEVFKELNKRIEPYNRFGIYTSGSTYATIIEEVGLQELQNYQIWLSNPQDCDKINQVRDNGPICRNTNGQYECDVVQASCKITDLGIGNDEGYVDFNLCYVDYKPTKEYREIEAEIIEIKEYDRNKQKQKINIPLITIGGLSLLSLSIYTIRHKKRIKKKIQSLVKKIH